MTHQHKLSQYHSHLPRTRLFSPPLPTSATASVNGSRARRGAPQTVPSDLRAARRDPQPPQPQALREGPLHAELPGEQRALLARPSPAVVHGRAERGRAQQIQRTLRRGDEHLRV